MKELGRTKDRGYFVELTEEEFVALSRLRDAACGGTLSNFDFVTERHSVDFDYAGLFGAVHAFTLARYRVNELERIVQELKGHFGDDAPAGVEPDARVTTVERFP